jgi:hypothetical protein
METAILCDPYVYENPTVLFRTGFFYTTNTTCVSELVNHLTLIAVIFTALGFGLSTAFKTHYLTFIVFLIGVYLAFPSAMALVKAKKTYESFQNTPDNKRSVVGKVDVIGKGSGSPYAGETTLPTARNPFMNVLIDEIKYNPTRPAATSVSDPMVQISLDDFFRTEFARDPTDVFGRNQSQREFITMPSTSIPNDVDSYQNWLYKIPGKTCKEGGREACLPGTDGGVYPWLNQDS